MFGPGWHENELYPGTHWLYYTNRGNYKARIDFKSWTKGLYQWRVMSDLLGNDMVGWEETLEEAQKVAEDVMSGRPHQMRLMV